MILFLRKLVADRFRSGFAVVTGIDLEPGKEFYLLARDMTVSIWIFFQIILVIFFCRIIIYQGLDLNGKIIISSFFDSCYALDCFFYLVIGVLYAGLILRSLIITLLVGYRRIDHIEICQKKCVKTYFFGIIFYADCFFEACLSGGHDIVVGVGRTSPVRISAFGIDYSRNGLH